LGGGGRSAQRGAHTHTPRGLAAQVAAAARQRRQRRRAARREGLELPPDEASDAHTASIGVGASLLVAAAAGCVNVVLTIPMWCVITQMQAAVKCQRGGGGGGAGGGGAAGGGAECRGGRSSPFYDTGALATARRLWADRGLAGFYAGLRPSLIMVLNPTVQVRAPPV
jgi:hypothetical protein